MQEISDRFEISELLDTYAAGVDSRDWDLVAGVFVADAVLDYTGTGGLAGSPAEVIPWIERGLSRFSQTQHVIANRRIRVDGDEASSTALLFNPMTFADGGDLLLVGGRYETRYRRTPQGWRIVEHMVSMAWMHRLPAVAAPPGPE